MGSLLIQAAVCFNCEPDRAKTVAGCLIGLTVSYIGINRPVVDLKPRSTAGVGKCATRQCCTYIGIRFWIRAVRSKGPIGAAVKRIPAGRIDRKPVQNIAALVGKDFAI